MRETGSGGWSHGARAGGEVFPSRERRTDWGAKSDGVRGSGDVPKASERCFEAGWIGEGDGSMGNDLDDVAADACNQGGVLKLVIPSFWSESRSVVSELQQACEFALFTSRPHKLCARRSPAMKPTT